VVQVDDSDSFLAACAKKPLRSPRETAKIGTDRLIIPHCTRSGLLDTTFTF